MLHLNISMANAKNVMSQLTHTPEVTSAEPLPELSVEVVENELLSLAPNTQSIAAAAAAGVGVEDDPVMQCATNALFVLSKLGKISIKAKGLYIPNAVSIANIITENFLKTDRVRHVKHEIKFVRP